MVFATGKHRGPWVQRLLSQASESYSPTVLLLDCDEPDVDEFGGKKLSKFDKTRQCQMLEMGKLVSLLEKHVIPLRIKTI